jgi:hypothetical protein
MISAAILIIVLITVGAGYLISKDMKSDSPRKTYGRIIAAASVSILMVVIIVGCLFITYFK